MNVLLFGATGTAGGAVLQACLSAPLVEQVRVVVRRTLGPAEAKLREFVHQDYLDFTGLTEAFRMVDACLFCLGTSVTQVSKQEYVKISHDCPVAAAKTLKRESPGAAFHYISGAGTNADSRTFWSKVKGQTENELMEMAEANCWRPGFIDATRENSRRRVIENREIRELAERFWGLIAFRVSFKRVNACPWFPRRTAQALILAEK
jgi:uncharacterized protein YbjT (DUF2867 family)